MATIQGTRLTLSDTVGLAVDMSPTIQLIDPFDVGFLSYFGMSSLDKEATATQHRWMEDELRPLTSLLTADPLAGGVTINVTAGTGTYFRADDVVKIEDELLLVTAVAADALTVTRGFGGSVAAAHAIGSIIEIVGVALLEGDATPGVARTTVKVEKSNYTQIFEDVVEISATLEAVEQWAPGSEYARQLAKTMKTLMILLDKTFYHGKPGAGSSTVPRSMAGVRHFITTNVTAAAGAALSETILLNALHAAYDEGGNPGTLFMTLLQKRFFNLFLGNTVRRTTLDETKAGAVVDFYTWDNGTLDVVIDRWMPKDEVVGLTTEYIGFGPLRTRNLAHEILPKQSREVQRGQITGEYTAEVKSEAAHFLVDNLDVTP